MEREEAINIVRKNIPHLGLGATEMTEALESLIPELRESEDERMRKALVKIVKSIGLKVFETEGVGKNNVLLYLEKQEQKPAEWSDKDKNIFKLALDLIKDSDDCDGILDKELAVKWFAELPSRFVPQPKQEWSEEDKQWLESIIREYEERLSVDKDHAAVIQVKIDLLKSLRPQKLDASKLDNFDPVDVLNRIKTEFPMAWEKVVWKPSEEQMKAFEDAMTYIPEFYKPKSNLASLLRDLKKLM